VLGNRAALIGALGVAVERMHDDLFGVGGLPVRPILASVRKPAPFGTSTEH
jgi:hypothetical protein